MLVVNHRNHREEDHQQRRERQAPSNALPRWVLIGDAGERGDQHDHHQADEADLGDVEAEPDDQDHGGERLREQ